MVGFEQVPGHPGRSRLKRLTITILLLFLALPGIDIHAQGPTSTPTPSPTLSNAQRAQLATIVPPLQCGSIFNPCGAMPWTVPRLPTVVLPSPTLIDPRSAYGSAPTVTPITYGNPVTGTVSPSPTATAYGELNIGPVSTLAAGISGIASTMSFEPTMDGTQDVGSMAGQFATSVPGVFSTIKGVVSVSRSKTLSVVAFLFTILIFVLLVQFGAMFFAPMLNLVRLILQVIQTFKPF